MTDKESVHVLMSKVMADIGAIKKRQRNEHFKFNFRGIDDVMNALYEPLTKHGVFYVAEILENRVDPGQRGFHAVVRVRYTFYGPAGDSVPTEGMGEASDTGDKAVPKALAIALKYALLHTFCIPTEEMAADDADRHAAPKDSAAATPATTSPKTTRQGGSQRSKEVGSEEAKASHPPASKEPTGEVTPSGPNGAAAGSETPAPPKEDGVESGTRESDSSASLAAILAAVTNRRVTESKVVALCARMSVRHEYIHPDGINFGNIATLPAAVLDDVARELGLGVPA